MEVIKRKAYQFVSYYGYSGYKKPQDNFIQRSGIIVDRFKTFEEYRNSFQNRFFHFLERDVFNDTNKMINNSSIYNDSDDKKTHLLLYTHNELNTLIDKEINSDYLDIYHKTEKLCKEIKDDMNLLKLKQQERIKTKVYESENKQIDKEIEKIIKSMTEKVQLCEFNLKKLSSISNSHLSDMDRSIKDNIQITLSQKIHEFSLEFRKNEEQFMEKLKKLGTNSSVIDDEDTSTKDFENKYGNNFLNQDVKDKNLIKKNEAIDSFLASINKLSLIFKDLQLVTQEQGTILDRIDYNIEISIHNTQKAYKHISETNKLQQSNCFRNIILLLMSIIFFECIFLINKYL